MSELKTMDEIIRCAPELNAQDVQSLNKWYTPYLFFNDDKKSGVQHCTCSSCRESFDISYIDRVVTPERLEFLQAGHNQTVRCPKCGANVTKKQKGIARKCSSLWEYQRAVFVKPVSKNEVYLIYVWSTKSYNNGDSYTGYLDYAAIPNIEINAVYYITPNQQRCFIKNPWLHLRWEEKSIREPFLKTWYYNVTAWKKGYVVFGNDSLKETFLKYFDDDMLSKIYFDNYREACSYYYCVEFPYVTALCRFAKHPSLEWLAKQGYDDFVYFMLLNGQEAHTLFDWKAKSPFGFFKTLTTPEIKELRAEGRLKRYNVKRFNQYKKIWPSLTAQQFSKICEWVSDQDRFQKAAKQNRFTLKDFEKYFSRRKMKVPDVNTWLDYIDMASVVGFDLSVHNVMFPKRLKEAHDNAVNIYNTIKYEDALKNLKSGKSSYSSRFNQLVKKYSFENGMYKVMIPISAKQIVDEGKALHHCVGGYAERHINGKTTILFIRLCQKEDKPLLTVEIRDSDFHIIQVHGMGNREPTKAEQSFINMWHKHILSPKKKIKKAAEAA